MKNMTDDTQVFARGYDPYNSVDRYPCGRESRVICLFSAGEVALFAGPSEKESRAASEFFAGCSAKLVDISCLNVTLNIPGQPPVPLEGIATDDDFDYTPPGAQFFGEP